MSLVLSYLGCAESESRQSAWRVLIFILGTLAWLTRLIRKIIRSDIMCSSESTCESYINRKSDLMLSQHHIMPHSNIKEFLGLWWEFTGHICRDIYHVTLGRMMCFIYRSLCKRFSIFNCYLLVNFVFLSSHTLS